VYNPVNDLWCAGIKRVDHKFNEVIGSLSTVRHDQSKSTLKSSNEVTGGSHLSCMPNATCSKPLGSPPTKVAAPRTIEISSVTKTRARFSWFCFSLKKVILKLSPSGISFLPIL
jgi:hypothetical protein